MSELNNGSVAPKPLESFRHHGISKFIINYDITEVEGQYQWKSVIAFPLERGVIIDAIINNEYPTSKMDAIRNNYDLVRDGTAGAKTEEYTQEYQAMQALRVHAKEIATEIIESLPTDEVQE